MPQADQYPTRDAILTAPFPLFGLPAEWQGARHVVAVERSDGRLTGAILGHGDPDQPGALRPSGPWLKVEISDLSASARPVWEEGPLWQHAAEQLLGKIASPPEGLGKEQARRLAEDVRQEAPGPDSQEWRPVEVEVDRQSHQFRRFERGDHWAAVGHVGEVFLSIYAYRFPVIGLRLGPV